MKKWLVLLSLFFVLTSAVGAAEYLTLELALEQVENHPDYIAWLGSVEQTESAIAAIFSKEDLRLDLSSTPLNYSYNLATENSTASFNAGLSLAKKFLSGPNLSFSVTPSKSLTSDQGWRVKWQAQLSHNIWPPAGLSADRLSLEHNENTLQILHAQRAYVLLGAKYKIEELYRTAQLVEARVQFAQNSLQTEEAAWQVLEQRAIIGEAGEVDLITGQLSLLRAEKELEQAEANAQNALQRLQTALGLEKTPQLPPLIISDFTLPEVTERDLAIVLEDHPLVLSQLGELQKAKRELQAAQASLKPGADFSLSVNENNADQLVISASVRISHSFLDGNQKQDTVESRMAALDALSENYAETLRELGEEVAAAVSNLSYLSREAEIAKLTLQKTELEWAAALKQHALGMIDDQGLAGQESLLLQARLNFYEAAFTHDLALRRLENGILRDLAVGDLWY